MSKFKPSQLIIYTTELPGGGTVEVTDRAFVPFGNKGLYTHRELTYRHPGDVTRLPHTVVFQTGDAGIPVCASVRVDADGGTGVMTKHLKALRLEEIRADVFAFAGLYTRTPQGDYMRRLGRAEFETNRGAVAKVGSRRRMTPHLLAQIASIHNGATPGGKIAAVKNAFHVERRQALRYISAARDAGLISEDGNE